METSGPTSGIPQLLATNRVTGGQWQVGQLLQATVTENSIGKVLLDIGNRQVSAETSLPLQKGQQLTLQVRSLGEQPVLRITSVLKESPVTMAVRLLLPKQGPMTPLLSSMGQLARIPHPATPPLINELVRSVIRQLPDVQTASSAPGLKKAIANSGVYLERQLLQSQSPHSGPVTINTDLKANLLRLVQLVRNWPGSSQASSGPRQATSGTPASTPGGLPAGALQTVHPTGTAATSALSPRTQTSPVQTPVVSTPTTLANSTLTDPTRAQTPPQAVSPASTPPATGQTATPPASPDQVQRTIQSSVPTRTTGGERAAPATTQGLPGTTMTATGGGAAGPGQSVSLTGALPPPFRGSIPVPQSAVQTSLDLLNRLGNFRTDLLQQAEAALARIQMNQLAAVPREGERGLLEWLFELPIRRGDDIDLWSMRVFRDPYDQPPEKRQQTASWSVQLAFDLPGLGPLQAQVQLYGEQVSTRFWAGEPDTLPLLREHMHELRQALNDAGLEVGDLDCQPGPRATATSDGDKPLISEKV